MNLFDLLVNEDELHPNFTRIKSDPYKVKLLEEWGDDQLIGRDGNGKFIKEFQTTFNSAFWELYCYKVLQKLGAVFDFEHDAPDFTVALGGKKISIECTIASNAKEMPMESDIEAHINDTKSLEETIYDQTVRLSNAFTKKVNKYQKSYCKKEWVKENPFIVAIEPFDQPYFMITGHEAIRLLLYGWKTEHKTLFDMNFDEIAKNEKSNLKMGLFTRPEYADISGVLFSNTATIGKVDAMSEDPNLVFGHLRYNLSYDRPLISFDSKIKYKKNDLICEHIKRICSESHDLHKQYTIRRPLLQWNVDYKEDVVDGLMLFLNPYAKYPIHKDTIQLMKDNGVNIISYDLSIDNDEWDVHDRSLIQRKVFKF